MRIIVRGEFDNNSYSKEWLGKLNLFEEKLIDFFSGQSCKEIVEILFVIRILSNDDFYLNQLLKYSKSKKILMFSTELRKYSLDDYTDEQIEHNLLITFRNSLALALDQKKLELNQLMNYLGSFVQET